MSENIVIDTSLRLLSRALDEYTHWHTSMMRQFFYPHAEATMSAAEPPAAFTDLHALLKSVPEMIVGDIERVFNISSDVHALATCIAARVSVSGSPSLEEFNEFSMIFDDFMTRLLTIERQQYFTSTGYDPHMGIRLGARVIEDLAREIERMDRWGFTLLAILVRLDGEGPMPIAAQKKIGEGILASVRNFDDAYKMGDREIFILLKNADHHAGYTVVSRMREFFESNNNVVSPETGETILLPGFSFCLAEPYDSEEPEALLRMMRGDLTQHVAHQSKTIVMHEEESPLRRYLREIQKK